MYKNALLGAVIGAVALSAAIASAVAAEGDVATLARITGNAVVSKGAESSNGTEGMGLTVGERVMSRAASTAVVEFKDGCRYTLKANESFTIGVQSPCALCGAWGERGAVASDAGGDGTARAGKAGEREVANVSRITGDAVVSKGAKYVSGTEGMGLTVGERIMSLAGSTTVIQYRDGCRYTLEANELLTIDDESPCSLCWYWGQHGVVASGTSAAGGSAGAGGAAGALGLSWVPPAAAGLAGILGATLPTGDGAAPLRPAISE
jgi:hypothetical protein